MTAPTRFALLTRESYKDQGFAIHAEGCKDIRGGERRKYGARVVGIVEGSLQSAIDELLGDEAQEGEPRNLGYGEEAIHIAPCCKR